MPVEIRTRFTTGTYVATMRGTAGAARLVEEMRRQWRSRAEWLT